MADDVIADCLAAAMTRLGCLESPALESQLLLAHITGRDRIDQENGRHDNGPPDEQAHPRDQGCLRGGSEANESRPVVRFQEQPLFRQVAFKHRVDACRKP